MKTDYQLGWWPQHGLLDRIDRGISLPIMKLDLGMLEYIIVVPGTWFGLPPMVWGILPFYLAAYVAMDQVQDEILSKWLVMWCFPLTAAGAWYFFKLLNHGDIHAAFAFTKYLIFPTCFAPHMLTEYVLGEKAAHAVSLLLCAWLFTETMSHMIKITARRMRPVVWLAEEINDSPRKFTALQDIVRRGETAFQSFPSGDAGGAMVFSYVLYHYAGEGELWVWSCVFLSAFGRIYLHAHHFFDVLIGAFTGVICTQALIDQFGLHSGLNAYQTTAAMMIFVTFHIFCRRYLAFEIPKEFHGESIYGHKYHHHDE